jgi:hypothetical protein
MKENFEDGYQDLTMLQGVPEAIEAFTTAYESLLNEVHRTMQLARTLAEIQECRARGKRLKQVLMKQVAYVGTLKDEALINEDTAWPEGPAVEA